MDNSKFTATMKARVAEQAERYEDMVTYVNQMVEESKGSGLGTEDRNLLSVAYKNVVGACRASWRALKADPAPLEDTGLLDAYRATRIEPDLRRVCGEAIALVNRLLEAMPDESDAEARVFYLKMKGDYYRYIAEIEEDETSENAKAAAAAYGDASDAAEKSLPPTSPLRLGVALNYSVFQYEICKQHEKATKLAKQAFDEAIAKLDELSDDNYKDATLIMQLIRDNLQLWTSTNPDE